MASVTSAQGPIHLGMDTSKKTIVVAVLMPGEEIPVLDRIWNEEGSVRHLIGRLGEAGALRCCREQPMRALSNGVVPVAGRAWLTRRRACCRAGVLLC